MQKITHTLSGATQTVSDVVISDMQSFGTAFLVEGLGSALTLNNVTCDQNYLQEAILAGRSRSVSFVVALDQSTATVSSVEFGNKDGVGVSPWIYSM